MVVRVRGDIILRSGGLFWFGVGCFYKVLLEYVESV